MFKYALIQTVAEWNYDPATKAKTKRNAERLVKEAASNGAQVVSLPEMWIGPYENVPMKLFAEERGGETYAFLSRLAKENGIYLIGGSIPEREGDKYYNTCFVFDPQGNEVARHRKVHLFGIDVPGKQTFTEADLFTPGDSATTFDTPYGRIGVAICYDVRFRDPIEREALDGAILIVLPSSFAMITGRAHWDTLIHYRAMDSQVYFAGNGTAHDPDETIPYHAWGHSAIYDPWGDQLALAGSGEEILYATIDPERVREVRATLPVMPEKLREDAK